MNLLEILPVALLLLLGQVPLLGQTDVETIIQRSVEANKRDWNADPQFDYTERDQEKGVAKTYEVTMLFGSPYQRVVAVNGRPRSRGAEEV